MLPYGRKYFADQAGDGYYVEAAAGPIIYFEEFFDQNLWAQMRLGVGSQWYTGKKNRPVDFNLSMNYDSMFISGSQAQGLDAVETGLIGIIGPWSLVKFRLQFGFGK